MRILVLLTLIYLASAVFLGWWYAWLAVGGVLLVMLLLASRLSAKGTPEETIDAETHIEDARVTDAAPSDSEELRPAITALHAGAFARCIELAQLYAEHPSQPVRMDALYLCALSWSRLDNYANALPFWESLAYEEDTPKSWLDVALSRAMTGDFDDAGEAFDHRQQLHNRAMGAKDGTNVFIPMETANFLTTLDRAGRPDLAMPLLDQLAGCYRSLHVTDTQFLHARDMPFFQTFLQKSLPIVRKVKDSDTLRAWYRAIHDDVDEDGKAEFSHLGVPC